MAFGVGAGQQQTAGSNEGHEQVLIDGQLGFAAGEEAQAGMEPVGEVGSDAVEAFVGEGGVGVTPRIAFAGVAAGQGDGGDARINVGGDQRLLAVAGVTGDGDFSNT